MQSHIQVKFSYSYFYQLGSPYQRLPFTSVSTLKGVLLKDVTSLCEVKSLIYIQGSDSGIPKYELPTGKCKECTQKLRKT